MVLSLIRFLGVTIMTTFTNSKFENMISNMVNSYMTTGYTLAGLRNNTEGCINYQMVSTTNNNCIVISVSDFVKTICVDNIGCYFDANSRKVTVTEYLNFDSSKSLEDNLNGGVVGDKALEKEFYYINDDILTDSVDEFKRAKTLNRNRGNAKFMRSIARASEIPMHKLSKSFFESVMKKIKAIDGFSRARQEDIMRIYFLPATERNGVKTAMQFDVYVDHYGRSTILTIG